MDTRLSDILHKLDLTPDQIAVYELILKDRQISISEICRRLPTNRIFVYRTVEILAKEGLLESKDRDGEGFRVANPGIVLSLLQKKQLEASKAVSDYQEYLPEILTNWYGYRDPIFKTYDGKDKFWYLFNNILEAEPDNSTFYVIGSGKDFHNIINVDYFNNIWTPKRVAKNINSLLLIHPNNPLFTKLSLKSELKRDWKVLPDEFDNFGSIWLINDKIILWDTFNAKAFEIRNHTLSQFLKGVFRQIWNKL